MQTVRLIPLVLVSLVQLNCGDDGDAVDASTNPSIDALVQIDAPLNGVDARPPVDATPLPPDASTVGRACSFPDTVTITLSPSGVGGALLCFDPATGANCRVIEQIRASCYNDQVGFVFGVNEGVSPTQRSIRGVDGGNVTAGSIGTLMGPALINIPNATAGTVTAQFPGGQQYTAAFQYNSTTLSLTSLTGPN